jgi:hypothetical protein
MSDEDAESVVFDLIDQHIADDEERETVRAWLVKRSPATRQSRNWACSATSRSENPVTDGARASRPVY